MFTKTKYYKGDKISGKFFTDLISDADGSVVISSDVKVPKTEAEQPIELSIEVFFKIAMRGNGLQPPFFTKKVNLKDFLKNGLAVKNFKSNTRFKVRIYGV